MSNTSNSLSSAIENAKKDLGFIKSQIESINESFLKTKELLNLSDDEFKGIGLAFVKMTENSDYDKIQEDIFKLLKGKDYFTAKEILKDALEILEVKSKVI